MKEPYTIKLEEGQSVVVWHNGKILIKTTSAECRSIFTAWDSFIGTADEVNAEIARLGLVEPASPKPIIPTISKRSTEPPKGSYAVAPEPTLEPVAGQSVISKATSAVVNTVTSSVSTVWNTITNIFTNKSE